MKIHSTDELEIWKHQTKENSFVIQFKHESKSVLKSILKTNIITGSSISNEYKTLTFKAHSIQPICSSSFSMNYDMCMKLIYFLTTQIEFLITVEKKCFYKLIPSNIFLIDNTKFLYLSNEYLLDIHENNKMTICCPFSKEEQFDSPELLELITIPAEIHYKTIYYSLASLVIYFLNNENNETNETNKIEGISILGNVKILEGTKLFGLLKRCLHIVPEKRSILFV